MVRDAFLERFPGPYDEIVVRRDVTLDKRGVLTSGEGFRVAAKRYGERFVSGIRSEESRGRQIREAVHGASTERSCAPITRWSHAEVFGYLHRYDLPVHPAYAMLMSGTLRRDEVRVSSLGGLRGRGRGRGLWEERYYGAALRRAEEASR